MVAVVKMNPPEKGVLLRCLYMGGLVTGAVPAIDLSGSDFSGADLRGAVLPSICLFNVDLTNADLRGANLSGGVLQWARINGTKFEGSRLVDVVIDGNEIEDAGQDPTFLRSLGADVRRPD